MALMSLAFSWRAARRQRLIDDLPTSKTTGVFIGQVELKGTAEAERPLISHLAQRPCVHYVWSVEEHWSRTVRESYTDSKGHRRTRTRHESGWKTVAGGGDQIAFYLQDDSGVIRVEPRGADIEGDKVFGVTCGRSHPLYYGKGPAHAVSHSDHRRRFHETAIPLHARVYVNGPARERQDIVAPEIVRDADAPLFIISTRSEAQITRGLAWQFWLLGGLALLIVTGGYIAPALVAKEAAPPVARSLAVALGAGTLGVWLLGWVWLVYNSLVNLRQRVRQGWANVDVQLKRRADLIPNLVRAVEGLRDHERQVQEELARLRGQLVATAPGQAGPDPAGCVPLLRAIVERYPELKANESFLALQRGLAETEERIALARAYFNDIATFYNTRLARVPDGWLAALARLRPQPLITATDFERAPVAVRLAERGEPQDVRREL